MRKIYQTGLKAAAYYGTEIVGLTNPELIEAQSLYLKIAGPRCATRSRSLALSILGDPVWSAALGPAIYWANLVWRVAHMPGSVGFSIGSLRAQARVVLQKPPKN